MYMQGFKCSVTGTTATHFLASAVPAVYCKDEPSKCVKGSKQMIVFNQAEGNNVPTPREARSPGYNADCGFLPGAQKDIFVGGGEVLPAPSAPAAPVVPPISKSSPVRAALASASAPVVAPVVAPSVALPVSSVGLPPAPPVVPASTLFSQVRSVPTSAAPSSVVPASTLFTQVRSVSSVAASSSVVPGKTCKGRRK